MQKLVEWSGRAMKILLLGFIAICLLVVILYFIVIQPAANQVFREPGQGSGLIPASGPRDSYQPQKTTVYLYPQNAIPTTQAERYNAPAQALLPDRWATNQNADQEVGPSQDVAQISYTDRVQLVDAVQNFLSLWETFTPPTSAQDLAGPQAYVTKLQPWVDPGALSDIVNRVDNAQGDGICPNFGCSVGSTFISKNLWDSTNVRYYNSTNAYVTAFGDVTYKALSPLNPLNGATFERTYGLLLRLENGRWLVTRAAAASDGPIS